MIIFKKRTLVVILSLVMATSCSKKYENYPTDVRVKSFVWGAMNAFYMWQDETPDLADDKFKSQEQLHSYLEGYKNTEEILESLRHPDDEESKIYDDYTVVDDALKGYRNTTGLKVVSKTEADGTVTFLVTDIVENSSAAISGIKIGDQIDKINDVLLTPDNIDELLSEESYEVSIQGTDKKHKLSSARVFEDPIRVHKVLKSSSKSKVIGYLMYDQFSIESDQKLNDVFSGFKTDNVTDLILDLRNNNSGSISSAVHLASMITGQFEGKVFAKELWNPKVVKNIKGDRLNHKFVSDATGENQFNINSLNLDKVYIITSKETAGVSEVLINCLKDYINVCLIGEKTAGKSLGLVKLYDAVDYKKNGEKFITDHKKMIELVGFTVINSKEKLVEEGFEPDVAIAITIGDGNYGDLSEPVLGAAVKYVNSGKRVGFKSRRNSSNNSWNSLSLKVDYQKMYK